VLIGVNEIPAPAPEISVYPNPAGNNVTVEWPGASENDPIQLNVYDLDSKLVFSEIVSGEQANIETAKWLDGMYIIEGIQKQKIIGRKQVMILH